MNLYQYLKAIQDRFIPPQQPKRLWNLLDKDPNANCVRVVNPINPSQKAELLDLIFTHKLPIIIGTETWLSSDIHDSKIIPEYCNYIIYCNDRTTDGYGGIMVAISK